MTFKTLVGGFIGLVLAFSLLPQAKAAEGMTTRDTLLDRIQIEDLMIEYYWAFSNEEGHDIKKYWTEDGEFDIAGNVVKGWAAIEAAYSSPETADENSPKFVMLLGNPMIRVTGDTAVMDAVFTGMTSTDTTKAPIPTEQGTDHVEFVKVDGQWKIRKRVLVTYGYVPRTSLME